MLGPIVGPSLGGYLTEYYSWRWVFFINLPLGIASFVGLMFFLPDSKRIERPFDKLGFATLSIVIACLQLIMDRGEQKDWFASLEIQIYVGLILASAWVYVVHSLRTAHPFLSPGMLRDRNLQLGVFFMFATGLILLATMALLPPFMQNLMGYSVIDVGYTLAPRGFGTLLAMMCVSRIGNRIDPRWMILFGLTLTAYALHLMTEFSSFVPRQDIVVSGVIQGFGLGFVFIPLSTVSYVTLDPKYRAEAASLFSLIRNMGSSIGVSVAFTYFSRNARVQHAYLTEAVTPYSTWLNLDVTPDAAIPGSSAALQLVDLEMMRQAATIAYVGDFYLMMWVVLILVPCVFFMAGKPKAPPQPKPA
jgi:DHA2 family multidrug resistance protein